MTARGNIKTKSGDFTISHFTDGCEEAVALYKGNITGKDRVLCRIHSECMTSEVFNAVGCDCPLQMENCQQDIQKEGLGIIIYLPQQGRGNGLSAYIASLDLQENGLPQDKAYEALGFPADRRSYDMAAKILKYFGINSIRLISSNKEKLKAFEKWGIAVNRVDYSNHVIDIKRINTVLEYNKIGKSVSPVARENNGNYVLVIADLCADYFIKTEGGIEGNIMLNLPEPAAGGTAYNAATAFAETGIKPVVFGKVGNDLTGRMIMNELETRKIISLIEISPVKKTASCILFYSGNNRVVIRDDLMAGNANDYDLDNLKKAVNLGVITKDDYIFFVGHFLTRCGTEHSRRLMETALSAGARIIFDAVPHDLYTQISLEQFNFVIRDDVELLVAEYRTLTGLLGRIHGPGKNDEDEPADDGLQDIMKNFRAKIIDIRYGEANISKQIICVRDKNGETFQVLERRGTGFDGSSLEKRKGFGDKLTAATVEKYLTFAAT
ncbi:MAG: PfkB family carbohydrate kinase [Treponema sp.]|jgi:GTP cyclohydrolase II|nr:PfkB family carbohydrate kinase [Treponema sp.]